jgi:inorganic phosphate transporter, PiT family
LSSSHLGMALSTTHVATGSILGSGLGRRGATVRWGVAGRMVVAWLITLPSAALVGATCWWISHTLGGYVGVGVVFAGLVAAAISMFLHARKTAINAGNVNADWVGGLIPVEPAPERERVEA